MKIENLMAVTGFIQWKFTKKQFWTVDKLM